MRNVFNNGKKNSTPGMRNQPDTSQDRKCLITGATGFIGSHLGRMLSRRGWAVTALARQTSDRSGLASCPVHWATGDVADRESLASAVRGQAIVFHCAGLTKALDATDLFRVNGEGTRNLLEVCAAAAPPPGRIVVLSSQAAAGPTLPDGRPRGENDPCEPVSDYGRSKLQGEQACAHFTTRLPIVLLRPVVVYGPREKDLYTLFKALRRFPVLAEAGFRPVTIQAIHSRDLAEAMMMAATAAADRVVGRTFFVGHPRSWTSDAFGRLIGKAVGRRHVAVVRIPWGVARLAARTAEAWGRRRGAPSVLSLDKLREMAAGSWLCQTDDFQNATGYSPRIDAPEGLRATGRWYRNNGWL